MRQLADAELLRRFLRELGAAADEPGRVYLTGGATAVLLGWRESTLDADIVFVPDSGTLYAVLPRLKEELRLNIEIASPAHFIPELPGWRDRSRFICREGALDAFHYDFYAQALAKLERGHAKDLADVAEMARRALIEKDRLRELFEEIQPRLNRFPAIDPKAYRRALERFLAEWGS